MNIAILADNLTFGGVNRYCLDLADRLRTYPGVNVALWALPDQSAGWLLEAAQARDVTVQVLPMRSTFDLRVVAHIRRWLVEQRVDILHSQDYRGNIISRLAVRVGGLPARLVCTKHGLHYPPGTSGRLRLFFALDYLSMFMSDRIIAVSADTCQSLARWGLRKKLRIIHNGTALPASANPAARQLSRQTLDIPPDARVVVFVGRLTHEKAPETLVDVARKTMAALDNVVFLLVGDGPCMSDIQRRAQDLAPRFRLPGRQEDVTPFYLAADVLFLPSRYEGLPMTLLEAFAHGLPAVTSDVGGIPEVLQDGVNGFMCQADNTAQMCERLEKILRDDHLRNTMGAQARRTVETHFTIERMVSETWQLYRQLRLPFAPEDENS